MIVVGIFLGLSFGLSLGLLIGLSQNQTKAAKRSKWELTLMKTELEQWFDLKKNYKEYCER